MLGYKFVSLTPEQVEIRRKLLDQAGFQAYLLPIAILLAVFVLRWASNTIQDDPKSLNQKPSSLTIRFRRLRWCLNDTYLSEFGPLHVQVIGSVYTSALLYIIVKGTGNDYMHVTKAFGHVAVSQLPIHYLLSIKHPQSPITLATGLTHERLNAYHRLLGRIIHALLTTHASLYIWFFIAINVLGKRIKDLDVIYGFLAISTMDTIGVLTLPSIRRKAYHKLFYRSHVILSLLLLVIVWLHVPYTRSYVGQAAFFWVTNGIARKGGMAEKAAIRCRRVGGGLLEVIAMPENGMSWEAWVPGMHGYLNHSGLGPRTPFTVVDATEIKGQAAITLVVRDLGGPMTGLLGRTATQRGSLNLELEGPYGEAKEYMSDVLKRVDEPILLVAGGVGATYALPIYLALAEKRKSASKLKLVWFVKQVDDATWGVDLLRGKAERNVLIHITQGKNNERAASDLVLPGIEIVTGGSRPNLAGIVDAFLGSPEKSHQPVSFMVCGPGGLSQDLRKAITKYAWYGRKVRWFEEQFGFGGS